MLTHRAQPASTSPECHRHPLSPTPEPRRTCSSNSAHHCHRRKTTVGVVFSFFFHFIFSIFTAHPVANDDDDDAPHAATPSLTLSRTRPCEHDSGIPPLSCSLAVVWFLLFFFSFHFFIFFIFTPHPHSQQQRPHNNDGRTARTRPLAPNATASRLPSPMG